MNIMASWVHALCIFHFLVIRPTASAFWRERSVPQHTNLKIIMMLSCRPIRVHFCGNEPFISKYLKHVKGKYNLICAQTLYSLIRFRENSLCAALITIYQNRQLIIYTHTHVHKVFHVDDYSLLCNRQWYNTSEDMR